MVQRGFKSVSLDVAVYYCFPTFADAGDVVVYYRFTTSANAHNVAVYSPWDAFAVALYYRFCHRARVVFGLRKQPIPVVRLGG